jgi:hypothetical protein
VADYRNPEYMLRLSIWLAPAMPIPSAEDARHHGARCLLPQVADKVLEQIKLSGWLIESP